MSLRFTTSPLALTSAFDKLLVINPSIQELASLLESLNACSSKRIDELDFNCRLTAFMLLNEEKYAALSYREWFPVLSNALYFVQDPDELAIRNNAAFTIRCFIDLACKCRIQNTSHANYPSGRPAIQTRASLLNF
ncbi:hypothetical protein DFJ58DRAFT_863052 [Suillus subalutaceus]|uniref:uncharacterized protein n=1 Tax=Suillus subalutaceus TaxID=48586 RepID=UPI001B862081|nr:uncharacterized protein DFJ58DRAFT_863052 [Suillus subalutaceus]KAG1837303.1 hypothetical protein DFJ58DRAFT_863052 [Suillus subalutaceus]